MRLAKEILLVPPRTILESKQILGWGDMHSFPSIAEYCQAFPELVCTIWEASVSSNVACGPATSLRITGIVSGLHPRIKFSLSGIC